MNARRLLQIVVQSESKSIAVALLLLFIAIVLPQLTIPRNTFSWIVVFDISQSMNVEDYELEGRPASRLAYARHAVRQALHELPCGSRIGLGIFTEYRTLPLMAPVDVCANYHDLLVSLDYIDGAMRWRDSSEVTKGVFWSIRASKELGQDSRILFLTDGHEAPPLRPAGRPNFEDIKPGDVPGWLIGVGNLIPQPIPRTDREGNQLGYWSANDVVQRKSDPARGEHEQSREHLSSLREQHLRELAQRVGFDYARLSRITSVRDAMLDRRYSQRTPAATDLFWLPASVALLLLVLRFRPDVRLTRRAKPSPGNDRISVADT